jgi:hypothetical protein
MKKLHLFDILYCTLLAVSILPSAQAASFSINFYEQRGNINENGHNFFDDYTYVGGGTFEISDSAVMPDNLVMFSDPEFLSFETSFTGLSTGDMSTFTLGIDDFEEGDTNERGLLFDAAAVPLRFDRPVTTSSGNRTMCDPTCEIAFGSRATVVLVDNDLFEAIYLGDGTVTTKSNNVSGAPFTPFAGNWTYLKGTSIGGSGITLDGFYTITAVPVPAAFWLFTSGLLGLIGISRRKKEA